MCGIAGIVSEQQNRQGSEARIEEMLGSISHRGPDARGTYFDQNITLGHNRLRILDLNPRADQPMVSTCGQVVVVFNGEIYNYRELRNETKQKGHIYKSRSDTEVIVHLYEEYGEDFVKKLNGMFSFAIWDEKQEKLILGRDRIGVKPLFYFFDGNKFIFSNW